MSSRTLDTILNDDFNVGLKGIEKVVTITGSQAIAAIQPRTLYIIETASLDITVSLGASSNANKGAYSHFLLRKGGTGRAIISSTTPIGGQTEQIISEKNKSITVQDIGTLEGYAIIADTRVDNRELFKVFNINSTPL